MMNILAWWLILPCLSIVFVQFAGCSRQVKTLASCGYGIVVLLMALALLRGWPLGWISGGLIASAGITLMLLFVPVAAPGLAVRVGAATLVFVQLAMGVAIVRFLILPLS